MKLKRLGLYILLEKNLGREDIYTVQKLGRWKTISMVMRYAHHYPESLRSGVEVLDKVGQKVITNLAQSNKKGVTNNSHPLK